MRYSGPDLERKGLLSARQDRVCLFVEELADGAVTLLCDPAGPIEFAGLVLAWGEVEVGAGGPLPLEPARLIDGGGDCGRGLHADALNAHKRLASRRRHADRLEFVIHLADLINQADMCSERRGHRLAEARGSDGGLGPREEPLVLASFRPDSEGGAEPRDGVVELDMFVQQYRNRSGLSCSGQRYAALASRRSVIVHKGNQQYGDYKLVFPA